MAHAGIPALTGSFMDWHLFFARRPEQDLEFTEEDLADAAPESSTSPPSPKPSNKRPILWLLLLAVLGGVAYVAMDPDVLLTLLEPDGEDQQTGTAAPPPAPLAPAVTSPAPTATESSSPTSSAPPPMEQAGPQKTVAPRVPAPLFAEGQRVSVVPDPARPSEPVLLYADSSKSKPGPSVPPGKVLTVLDGELQGSLWMYVVLTDDGRRGWIAEKQLKFSR